MTKFFVDKTGNYIGGFDGAEPPVGAVEVPYAPSHAAQVWTGAAFADIPTSITAAADLAESDAGMIRVVEDLISLLESKDIITRTELPQAVQDKLAARETARGRLGSI